MLLAEREAEIERSGQPQKKAWAEAEKREAEEHARQRIPLAMASPGA